MCKECCDEDNELEPHWIESNDSDPRPRRTWLRHNWVWVIIAILIIAFWAVTILVFSGCATNPKGVDTQGAPIIESGKRIESPSITGTEGTKGGRVGVQWGFQPNIEILPGGGVWLVAVVFGLLAILAFIFRVQASIYGAQRNAAFEAIEVAADSKLPAQSAKKIFSKAVSGRWFGLLAKVADAYLERKTYKKKGK